MRFSPAIIRNPESGVAGEIFIPADVNSYQPASEEMAGYQVGQETRRLLSSAIDKIVTFNRDPESRSRLCQECGAFAVACVARRSLYGVDFNPGKNMARVTCGTQLQPPYNDLTGNDLNPGEVLYLSLTDDRC